MLHTTPHDAVPDALKHFDSLPASAWVRQPVVLGLFGFSDSTLWRKVKAGTFPKPVKLSERVTAWKVGTVRAWMQAQATA